MADITWHQSYPGGRIVARLGEIDAGAVFPGPEGGKARWMFWLDRTIDAVAAKSDAAAKGALTARVDDWLNRAGLTQNEATQ